MSWGPKSETVARIGTAGADAADREELRRESGRRVGQAELGLPLRRRAVGSAGVVQTRHIALDVRNHGRHARGGELLDDPLERLRLARAGRARDQAVAVDHAQRQPDDDVRVGLAVVDAAAEVKCGRSVA